MKQKKSERSHLCAHEEKLTGVAWGRDSSLSFLGGCHSDSSGEMRVGLLSLILLAKSGMSALGWSFKISLVDPLVQWIQSSSQRGQMSILRCVIHIWMWDELSCRETQLCPQSKVLHECLDSLLRVFCILYWLYSQWVTYGALGKPKSVAELLIAVENSETPSQGLRSLVVNVMNKWKRGEIAEPCKELCKEKEI